MNSYRKDPILVTVKCEMCPKNATNFVLGLCERCVIFWTNKNGIENMNITLEHVKAALVRLAQSNVNYEGMDNTLQCVIEEEQRRRKEQLEHFQNVREGFQNAILISSQENVAYSYIENETDANYCDIDIPRMNMRDLLENTRFN